MLVHGWGPQGQRASVGWVNKQQTLPLRNTHPLTTCAQLNSTNNQHHQQQRQQQQQSAPQAEPALLLLLLCQL